jgi:hypothetical protein
MSGPRNATKSIRGGFDHGNGFSSPQGARGQHLRRKKPREALTKKNRVALEVSPLKLASGIPPLCTESAGAKSRGFEKAPQISLLVHEHATRDDCVT